MPLPWFRRKRASVTEAPTPAASEHFEAEPLTVDEPAAPGGAIDGESSTTKKRRRGTRGGRNRKRKTGTAEKSVAVESPSEAKKPAVTAPPAPARREQKRREAQARQRQSAARKPIESRIKRLEEKMAKLNTQKAEIDARLADPASYGETRKEALKALIVDQAYVARELALLEAEWLELQQKLERVTA